MRRPALYVYYCGHFANPQSNQIRVFSLVRSPPLPRPRAIRSLPMTCGTTIFMRSIVGPSGPFGETFSRQNKEDPTMPWAAVVFSLGEILGHLDLCLLGTQHLVEKG